MPLDAPSSVLLTQLDVGGVGTRGGEFIAKDLEAAVDRDEVTRAAVAEIVQHGEGRGSWLVFCSGVAHARHVRDAIREHGISAETVTGDTPAPERDGILAAFKAGRLRCVTNANVLTTGFDAPGTDLIALLRPTKSVGLYVQMVGRGTRLAEGKDDCLVLDFAGNTARHGPIDTVDGRKKEKSEEPGEAPIKVCPECQTINHASVRRCIECDHEFPPPVVKVAPRAASDALLSTQIQATWCDVTGITYARHDKPGKPTSLRVTYECGLARHSEWVCFEHTGFPREKACSWWRRRAPQIPAPLRVTQEPSMTDTPAAPVAEPPATPDPTPSTEATRAMPQIPPAAPVATPAAPPAVDPAAEAIRAERDRIAALGPVLAASRGLVPAATGDALQQRAIAEGWSADALRGALWDAMVQGAKPPAIPASPANSAPAQGDPAVLREAMAEALAVRAMPGYQAQDGGRHSEFLGWRPSEMVAELMRARGERNVPRDTAKLAERAFHTTSDFPLLLSAAANKMLLAAYQPAQPTYRTIFLRRDFRDFKPHRHLRIGDFPNLVALNENGEIQAGTMSESQELVTLTTFARRIRVTRQMLVNDDLGAFTDFAAMIGRRVADFENATAYGLLNTANGAGPTLVTGAAAVFATAAARANMAATGTALDLPNLALGRAAIMKQKTLDGLPISIGSSMRLVVGPNQEMAARQLTVNVAATQTSNANIYAGFVQPLVEPLIPSNRWYLFSDPLAAPVYVYGYLNGAEGPQVTTGPVSGVDGVEVSVIFDFGVGAIDWRGAWFNAGT